MTRILRGKVQWTGYGWSLRQDRCDGMVGIADNRLVIREVHGLEQPGQAWSPGDVYIIVHYIRLGLHQGPISMHSHCPKELSHIITFNLLLYASTSQSGCRLLAMSSIHRYCENKPPNNFEDARDPVRLTF